jgi:hypothetical protein
MAPPIEPVQGEQVDSITTTIRNVDGLIEELEDLLPPPAPLPPPAHQPTTTAHTTAWYKDLEVCQMSMGGNVAFREWSIHMVIGDSLGPGGDVGKSFQDLTTFC